MTEINEGTVLKCPYCCEGLYISTTKITCTSLKKNLYKDIKPINGQEPLSENLPSITICGKCGGGFYTASLIERIIGGYIGAIGLDHKVIYPKNILWLLRRLQIEIL